MPQVLLTRTSPASRSALLGAGDGSVRRQPGAYQRRSGRSRTRSTSGPGTERGRRAGVIVAGGRGRRSASAFRRRSPCSGAGPADRAIATAREAWRRHRRDDVTRRAHRRAGRHDRALIRPGRTACRSVWIAGLEAGAYTRAIGFGVDYPLVPVRFCGHCSRGSSATTARARSSRAWAGCRSRSSRAYRRTPRPASLRAS